MRSVGDNLLAAFQALLNEYPVARQVAARDRSALGLAGRVQSPDIRALRVLQDGRRRNRRTHHALLRRDRDRHRAADFQQLLLIGELRVDLHRVRQLVRRVLHVLGLTALDLRHPVRQRQVDDGVLAARGPLAGEELEKLAVRDREADADRVLLDERDERLRALVHEVALRLVRRSELARDRRDDRAVVEVILRRHELRLRRGKGRPRAVALRERVVDGIKRDGPRLQQLLVPLVGGLGVLHVRLHLRQLRFGVLDGRLVLHMINAVEDIPFLDLGAVLKADLEDFTRHLRNNVDLLNGDNAARILLLPEIRLLRHLGNRQNQLCRKHKKTQAKHLVISTENSTAIDAAGTRTGPRGEG